MDKVELKSGDVTRADRPHSRAVCIGRCAPREWGLAYQQASTAAERTRLTETFDALVEEETGCAALDDRISTTADQRASLIGSAAASRYSPGYQ
jgi:hypothetical protein